MGMLKKAENTMAYFKAGILGFQGSGKTYTATLFAIGICKASSNNKVAFFDTETGSAFLLPKLKEAGIETFEVKSRAFVDVTATIEECEKEGVGVLIIDSITHIWRDLCDSYDKKLNRKGRLQFQDWNTIKKEWQKYTDLFVNSKVHIIVCGRAGYEYDHYYNEDGTKDLIKTGTKMKAESEFGFEPSLVIEMERVSASLEEIESIKNRQARQTYKPKSGSGWIHRAHVLKDRTDTLNGHTFDYPSFEDFKPHFDALNIGGTHLGVDTSRNSESSFDIEGRPDWVVKKQRKTIALEEIQNTMVSVWPSTGGEDKKNKLDFLDFVFGTRSWTAVEDMSVESLEPIATAMKVFGLNYKDKSSDFKDAWATAVDSMRVPKEIKEDDIKY